jgi:putative hydrolase of the HAD superfamily
VSRGFLIVFDLDDTLYLERDFVRSGLRRVGRLVEAELCLVRFAERCEALFESGERRRIFDRALEESGVPAEAGLVARLVEAYRTHEPEISLAPDAKNYFGDGATRARFAIITDGDARTQTNKVTALGLNEKVRHVRCTGTWGRNYWKPHPRAFREIEALSTVPADRHVYVADNPGKDFLAPNKLGWRTVQIERAGRIHTEPASTPDHAPWTQISSLDELDEVLERDFPGSPRKLGRNSVLFCDE